MSADFVNAMSELSFDHGLLKVKRNDGIVRGAFDSALSGRLNRFSVFLSFMTLSIA